LTTSDREVAFGSRSITLGHHYGDSSGQDSSLVTLGQNPATLGPYWLQLSDTRGHLARGDHTK
jgi:hypothetical protein